MRLKEAMQKELQHDNARPPDTSVVKTYLEGQNWEVLHHPPYSPDIAPSDYHLFRAMTHGLAEQHFSSMQKIAEFLDRLKSPRVLRARIPYVARKNKIYCTNSPQ